MKKSTKITLLVAGALIILVGIIGITYAFFSTGGSQEQANTFTSGCLNISLTDASSSINLTNTYPITDVEGLETTSYDFNITNTCETSTNYSINLESLNQVVNSLSADYIKVALSSDTVGNVISMLSDNTSVTPEIDGAYESYNLYTGILEASEEKTYHLKLWIDYDATVEQAANKVYQSKINVIANPETQVVDNFEATFNLEGTTLTSNLTNNVTSASYCITEDNICTPNTSASIINNSYTVELEEKTKQVATVLGSITVNESTNEVVCTQLNGTSKTICSNPNKINTPDFSKTAQANCDGIENCEETNGIYEAKDNDGVTYYYRGAVTNNYVQFAGYYWRIIRINGDGSIRMIYDGTTAHANGEASEDYFIGKGSFNDYENDNAYVGYMYGTPGSNTYEDTHANVNDSTIKKAVDNWYEVNIKDTIYEQYVDLNAGFCNDRYPSNSFSSSNGLGGIGTEATVYGSYFRNASHTPSYVCYNDNDLFTLNDSKKGNNALDYPIGLISFDEVLYAGGVYGYGNQNASYYLYSGQAYWTMSSPGFYIGDGTHDYARMFSVYSDGFIGNSAVIGTSYFRPVINLSSKVIITGSGTVENPYVVA